ncbi:MAG: hypothetical protein IJR99_06450, partial [Kiritimatiellae bacterium]|nr:hypothetical protein [Kiritimatiellia bacterium]
ITAATAASGVAASITTGVTAATAASGVAASITTGVTAATAASGVAASITTGVTAASDYHYRIGVGCSGVASAGVTFGGDSSKRAHQQRRQQ